MCQTIDHLPKEDENSSEKVLKVIMSVVLGVWLESHIAEYLQWEREKGDTFVLRHFRPNAIH